MARVEQLISVMFEAKRLMHDRFLRARSRHSPLQIIALRFIASKSNVTMKDIADLHGITPPSATVLVDNLVKAGLVRRSTDRSDRRSVRLQLTKQGQQLLKREFKAMKSNIKKALSILSAQEQTSLINIFKKLSTKFQH